MKGSVARKFLEEVRRKSAGRSQKELAAAAGVSQPLISMLLAGKRVDVSLETAAALSSALDISLDWLRPAPRRNKHDDLSPAQRWLLNPPPGSKAAEARAFGIDLTLNVELLRLTVGERIAELQRESRWFGALEKSRERARVRR